LQCMAETIVVSAKAFLHDINSKPVYTIYEVLEDQKIEPTSVLIIGGPAPQIAEYIGRAFGLPHRFPLHHGVANAVGAAVARVTSEITLQADTERGSVIIPEANMVNDINSSFNVEQAIALGQKVLSRKAVWVGAEEKELEISVTEKQIFNMIRGYSRTGQNIRLKMGITPGLIPEWKRSH